MDEKLPGVRVPAGFIDALDEAGDDAESVGVELTVQTVRAIAELEGVAGVHLMGMGRDDLVRAVVERAGLFPRPTGLYDLLAAALIPASEDIVRR